MSTSPRILTIMGSGETAPTMMKHHRELIARFPGTPKAVVLDTPYGFQENSAELASKAVEYFRKSVGHPIEIAGLTRLHGQDTLTVEQGLARVRQADYVFAGPGSTGGAVTFASAAALTLGRYTVPVYEIYKVGDDPSWLEGLDVLGEIGLNVAVIPHYDNAEGGHHDTRFCYLGEHRLAMLEEQLPADAHVIGVDEHTGVILDLDSNTATVIGNSTITVRIKGRSTIHNSGDVISIDALRDPATGATNIPIHVTETPNPQTETHKDSTSLANDTQIAERSFNEAMSAGDAAGAARAVLSLESAIHAWSADTLQGEEMDNAHAALRSMIVRLGDAAIGGLADPRDALDPVMNVLLELRSAVRTDKRYDLSDLIRDRLAAVKIEVRDTPQGVEWVINS
jgi:hypothetical protein